jgi:hypothetical protein
MINTVTLKDKKAATSFQFGFAIDMSIIEGIFLFCGISNIVNKNM